MVRVESGYTYSFHSGMTESAVAAVAGLEGLDRLPFNLLVAGQYHLGYAVAALNSEWFVGVVY